MLAAAEGWSKAAAGARAPLAGWPRAPARGGQGQVPGVHTNTYQPRVKREWTDVP